MSYSKPMVTIELEEYNELLLDSQLNNDFDILGSYSKIINKYTPTKSN